MTRSNSRQLAIETATRLFQSQGYYATGLTQIIEESGSPKGSFYHHFPNGKEELALAAMANMQAQVEAMFRYALKSADSESQFTRRVMRAVEDWLKQTDFQSGCPIAGFAIEGASQSSLKDACNDAYRDWLDQLANIYKSFGYKPATAMNRAHLMVTVIDGVVLMSRVARSTVPVAHVSKALIDSSLR